MRSRIFGEQRLFCSYRQLGLSSTSIHPYPGSQMIEDADRAFTPATKGQGPG